jgi:hypothetical protein
MAWLSGNKTYIIGTLMIVLGVLGFAGVSIPGYEVEPGVLINGGLLALGFRSAMNK